MSGARNMIAFLDALLNLESGIDNRRHEWYVAHIEDPNVVYFDLLDDGNIAVTQEGALATRTMTVREYFTCLGVLSLFRLDDPASLRAMQYASRNPWGFVGYQFGEAALEAMGYYRAHRAAATENAAGEEIESLYCGTLEAIPTGQLGAEVLIWSSERKSHVLATGRNRWQGSFTGKDGICSFEDLLSGSAQETIIRRLITHNLETICAALDEAHTFVLSAMVRSPQTVAWQRVGATEVSISGIIAAAHLCGPNATARYLIDGFDAKDETGTTLERYMREFGGYDIGAALYPAVLLP